MQPQNPQPTPEINASPNPAESLPSPITPEVGQKPTPEKAPAPAEKQPAPAGDSANQNSGAPAVPVPQPMAPATQPSSAQVADPNPPIADDVDVLEKDWVRKAKQVVEQTRDDPHLQSEVMGQVKADYVKKRYSKDLPTSKPAGQGA